MIQLVDIQETNFNERYKCKIGDNIRFPVDASLLIRGQEYGFKLIKYIKRDCDLSDAIEVNHGRLVEFKCMSRGSFRIRIKNFDAVG